VILYAVIVHPTLVDFSRKKTQSAGCKGRTEPAHNASHDDVSLLRAGVLTASVLLM